MLNWSLRRALTGALTVTLLCLISGSVSRVQAQIPKEPIKWSIKLTSPDKPLKIGDEFTVQLKATVEPGWHLYGIQQEEGGPTPTRISLAPDQPFEQVGGIDFSEPAIALDPNFDRLVQCYEGEATFTITLKATVAAPPGKIDVKVNASFQTCNDELCLPPKTQKLTATINIAAR